MLASGLGHNTEDSGKRRLKGMKRLTREQVKRLEDLPNVGKAVAADLRLLGIERPQDLLGLEPYEMYLRLNTITGAHHDPCMLDTFIAVVHFMEHGEALPWWKFTGQRKSRYPKAVLTSVEK